MKIKPPDHYARFGALPLLLSLSPPPQSFNAQTQKTRSNTITVQVNKPRASVSPHQFGIFFGDINFGRTAAFTPNSSRTARLNFPTAS